MGDFEVKHTSLAGRIGVLETRHRKLETPIFFPVINPFKREFSVEDLKKLKIQNFITNAYILKKNNIIGTSVHKFFQFDGTIMTDSGAYQILEYGKVDVTNEEIIKYQEELLSDIAVILDIPTGNTESKKEAEKSVQETIKRAEEAEKIISSDNEIIWVYPIQGGRFLDLVEYSSRKIREFKKYKMVALGSPTVVLERYEYEVLIDMIYTARSNLPRSFPLHLFGGGLPHIIPFAVALGVDSFDSASYILYARDNRYITRSRVRRLEELDYLPCSCIICQKYTKEELLEMNKEERIKKLAIHNLLKILEEINETKQAIKEDRLFEYLYEKSRAHPAIYTAYKRLLNYYKYLELYDSRIKGDISGIFLYDIDSFYRPELVRYKNYLDRVIKKKNYAVILCYDSLDFIKEKYNFIKEKYKDYDIYVYHEFFGIIPIDLIYTYPLSQHEKPKIISEDVKKYSYEILQNFLNMKKYEKVIYEECNEKLHISAST
ncbi:MAG: tRNA guanosine(15) transglycosylase TgtA [Sulfolobaceae archaeon]